MSPVTNSITTARLKSAGLYTGKTAHDFHFMAMDGSIFPLSQFRGKLILIVNTASESGFTPQYEALEELYKLYKSKGLTVIAVPCNDFGNHEPHSNNKIDEFCQEKYKISFPLMRKVCVTGDRPHPFYRWAEDQVGFVGRPRWSFHKYLIGPQGEILRWYAPFTSPLSNKIKRVIEEAATSIEKTTEQKKK